MLCAPKFGEFFLRYDANWKPIAVHQLMSSQPTKMMDRWNMMVLGAGNRLALAAGLSDGRNLLSPTRVLNLDTIVSKLVNLDTIVSKCRIGVK